MDSIIKDCTNNHISLLKIILIIMDKNIDINKYYKINELIDTFIINNNTLSNNKPHKNLSQEEEEEEEYL